MLAPRAHVLLLLSDLARCVQPELIQQTIFFGVQILALIMFVLVYHVRLIVSAPREV